MEHDSTTARTAGAVIPAQAVRPVRSQLSVVFDTAVTQTGYVRVYKAVLDRSLAAVLLVALSPLVLLLVLAVLLTSGRPALFLQERVGKDGVPFRIIKLRTMRADRRQAAQPIPHEERRGYHKSDHDPRHTSFGRVLRALSLDELPQLVNILRGEMSFVGPRPELPQVVATYEAWQHQRHQVRPGLTGPWQVSARGDGPMHHFAQLDVDYLSDVSLRGDLSLMVRTVPALLRRKGG